MNVGTLFCIEITKLKRSKIIWMLLIPVIILWLPSIFHADINFHMEAEGISPEHNFLIQGFMGFVWVMFPASMVVSTVLLVQTERKNGGFTKMMSLPLSTTELNLAKFGVLLFLAAVQMVLMSIAYFLSAYGASRLFDYSFVLSCVLVWKTAGLLYLASVPMAAFYYMISICIHSPVFAMGAGLASIVPSVLIMNTKVWYLYPMCYPFRVLTAKMHDFAANMGNFSYEWVPWIPVAVVFTGVCLVLSCVYFGGRERSAV